MDSRAIIHVTGVRKNVNQVSEYNSNKNIKIIGGIYYSIEESKSKNSAI